MKHLQRQQYPSKKTRAWLKVDLSGFLKEYLKMSYKTSIHPFWETNTCKDIIFYEYCYRFRFLNFSMTGSLIPVILCPVLYCIVTGCWVFLVQRHSTHSIMYLDKAYTILKYAFSVTINIKRFTMTLLS